MINSMSMWDVNMQTDCAKSFQSENLLNSLTTVNKEMLLMQVLEILGLTDFVLYERVSKSLSVKIHYLVMTVYDYLSSIVRGRMDVRFGLINAKIRSKFHQLDCRSALEVADIVQV